MSEQAQNTPTRPSDLLEPVQAGKTAASSGSWAEYLVPFLRMRIMAGVSLVKVKGLYHWRRSAASERRRTALNRIGRLADLCRERSGSCGGPVACRRPGCGGVAHDRRLDRGGRGVHPAGLRRQRFYRTRGCCVRYICGLRSLPRAANEMIQRMISKSGRRFSEKIMLKQIAKSGCRHG